jgi:5-methylcytosine-specific restriction protein B
MANPDEVDEDRLPGYYRKERCNLFALLTDFELLDPQWPLRNLVLRSNPDPAHTAGAFGNQTTPLMVFELFDPNATLRPPVVDPPIVNPPQPQYPLETCSTETGIPVEQLRRWIRALERKGQAILYGPPGTGKTFVAEHLARHLIGGRDGFAELVQFHPAYAYEDFVLGIRPETTDGHLSFTPQAGRFVAFCDKAAERSGVCVLVIDEINRANLAHVFGELMYLLEYRDRMVALAGGRMFRVPHNVRIIGTMNTADRSIALMDYALRRRFAFLRLDPDYELLARYHATTGFDSSGLVTVLREVNAAIGDPNYALGISFFLRQDLRPQLEDVWRMEIEPYLEEYFFDDTGRAEPFAWERVRGRLLL